MEFHEYIAEFRTDLELAGRAKSTVDNYCVYLNQIGRDLTHPLDARSAKRWIADGVSRRTSRARAQTIRVFGKWAEQNDGPDWSWWPTIKLPTVQPTPQPTVVEADYIAARNRAASIRDRLVVEILWSSGMRVSEVARIRREDVDLHNRCVLISESKTGRPRLAPLSDRACRLVRRLPRRDDGRLLGMTSGAIQQLLRRLPAPPAHAWRRGWAVKSLRDGVSETSVRAAGGWASSAMVSRYTAALSSDLAMAEFARVEGR